MTAETTQNATTSPEESRPRSNTLTWGQALAWLGVFALLALLFLGLLRTQRGSAQVGEEAPDFTLTTFDGQTYRLSELRGKVVVVNFWASWCKPCEQEAADLESAWRYYQNRDDVIFLGIAWTDTEKNSLDYMRRFDITYPNGADLGTRISQAYRTTGVPETYIVDKNGILASVQISPYESEGQIRMAIDPLLEK